MDQVSSWALFRMKVCMLLATQVKQTEQPPVPSGADQAGAALPRSPPKRTPALGSEREKEPRERKNPEKRQVLEVQQSREDAPGGTSRLAVVHF